jgi:hypothetical protein
VVEIDDFFDVEPFLCCLDLPFIDCLRETVVGISGLDEGYFYVYETL